MPQLIYERFVSRGSSLPLGVSRRVVTSMPGTNVCMSGRPDFQPEELLLVDTPAQATGTTAAALHEFIQPSISSP
jgi:hypothetical protein